jgi:hypothetical protein
MAVRRMARPADLLRARVPPEARRLPDVRHREAAGDQQASHLRDSGPEHVACGPRKRCIVGSCGELC